jgi:hypothetical protein
MEAGNEVEGRPSHISQCSDVDPPNRGERKKGIIHTISNMPPHTD